MADTKYHKVLTRMYGEGKVPQEAKDRASTGSHGKHVNSHSKAYSKALDKAKGFETKGDWVKRQKSFQKKNGHYDSRTTMEAHENK